MIGRTHFAPPGLVACLAALVTASLGVGCGGASSHASGKGTPPDAGRSPPTSDASARATDSGGGGAPSGGGDGGTQDSSVTAHDSGTPGASDSAPPPNADAEAPPSDAGAPAPASDAGAPVAPPQVPSGWNLTLDDEFDGNTLGPAWSIGTNLTSFVDNGTTYWDPYQPQEAEYLAASMVALQGSNLVLSTMASSPIMGPKYGSKSYVAGYITSYGNFSFQYGYAEFRIEMPDVPPGTNTGLWPALWLLNSTYANTDEIDILESYGADQTAIQMSAQPNNSVNATIAPGYHVLGVYHDASTIAFYVDDQLQKSFKQAMSSQMAILIGMQLGSSAFGWLPGPTPATWPGGIHGPMTADFKVDWAHVWEPP